MQKKVYNLRGRKAAVALARKHFDKEAKHFVSGEKPWFSIKVGHGRK
jgi:hypothetical protein